MIYAGKHLPEMRFYCDFPTSGFSSTSKVRIDVIGVVFGPRDPMLAFATALVRLPVH